MISFLYVAVAFVTIGTPAYTAKGSAAPFAAILSNVLGSYGAAGTAILAVSIVFGVVNAYTTGTSRVFYASARDGGFPKALAHVNARTLVPDRALITMFAWLIPVFIAYYLYNVDLETALLISSGAAIVIYVIGTAAGYKLLSKERSRAKVLFPAISFVISVAVTPFVGPLILASVCVALAALVYGYRFGPRAARFPEPS